VELNCRLKHDRFLPDGAYTAVQQRLGRVDHSERTVVVVYAFEQSTVMLPYMFGSTWMAPAGARAIGAALASSGFGRVRVVLQQWTPDFDPSCATLDGRPIQMLCISSMQIHSAKAIELIARAREMGPDRPLIVVGGPKAVYEPHAFFCLGQSGMTETDVAVLGEEFVLLDMLEHVLDSTGSHETLRQGFDRARREGLLENVPGLVYRQPDSPVNQPVLVHTGVQRLLRDLDELPHPLTGYALLERSHRGRTLKARPMPLARLRRRSTYASLVVTHGCKFNCEYCPIPAYNQRTWRIKSPDRFVREMRDIYAETGIRNYFGTDDNFFNSRSTVEAYFKAMAAAKIGSRSLGQIINFSTEATQIDVYKQRDLLPLGRRGGLRGLYFGVEDLDAKLVNKGQSPQVTLELFEQMCRLGISPMVLMMYYEGQPLRTPGSPSGLLDQAEFLHRHGAVSYQCTICSPAMGTKALGEELQSGVIFKEVAGNPVPDAFYDGNHVIADRQGQPRRRQWNLLRAYLRFYNPRNLVQAIFSRRDGCRLDRALNQIGGHLGLPITVLRYLQWTRKLRRGPIVFWQGLPSFPYPVIRTGDGPEPGGIIQLGINPVTSIADTA
jgi:radical SAM superfamily enzyme YgiQ (UPF0313 family)